MCPADRQFAATRPTVLMFHGNGGNHGHRIPLGKIFFGKMRCNVIMLSYRGYVLLALPYLPLPLSHRSRLVATATLRVPLLRRVRERPLRSYILAHRKQTRCIGLQVDAQTVLDYVHAHPLLAKTQVVRSTSQFCFGRFVSINFVLFADPLWPINRRRRRDRPRLSQPAGRKNIIGSSLPPSIMAADCRNVDHCSRYRKHIHVPPAAHSERNALAGPILLPLPPKVGILSQGNARSLTAFQ
jgi:hypothetical protein